MNSSTNLQKPAAAIDLDGTIAEVYWLNNNDGFRPQIVGDLIPGAREFLRELSKHYDVYIFTARASQSIGKIAINKWIIENGLRSYIKDVTNSKKYNFVFFLDDRAIRFTDPNTYQQVIKEFCYVD